MKTCPYGTALTREEWEAAQALKNRPLTNGPRSIDAILANYAAWLTDNATTPADARRIELLDSMLNHRRNT